MSQMHFLFPKKKRVISNWGGFNSIVETFNTIESAIQVNRFDRFVLLQGQDYPLLSNQETHNFFNKNLNTEFLKAKNISNSHLKSDRIKIACYWNFDKRNLFWKIFHKLNTLGWWFSFRNKYYHDKSKNKIPAYWGWAQFALTSSCIEYCLNFYKENKSFNKWIRHRFPPDELYFHTVIYNSKFRSCCNDSNNPSTLLNLTYFEYPSEVRVFKYKNEYEYLMKTGFLFARKINSSSKELIDEIDDHIKQ